MVFQAGGTVNLEVLSEPSAKLLSRLQNEIRGHRTIEELKGYSPKWFISEFGSRLAAEASGAYLKARIQQLKKRKKVNESIPTHHPDGVGLRPTTPSEKDQNAELPKIIFEWDEESIIAVNRYRNQAMIISGVRTKAALKELVQLAESAMETGMGFTEFISSATLAGYEPENPQHWRTEFETARVAAESGGRWGTYVEDQDIFPYLRYVTMRDNLVREEHALLDGTIAAVGDPFWDENMPPNGWNCRCSEEQVTQDEAMQDPKYGASAPSIEIDEAFRKNFGKTGELPGNTMQLYGEFAEGPDKELNSNRGTEGQRYKGKVERFAGAKEIKFVLDVSGYPVLLGSQDLGGLIQKPREVWQQKGITTYIQALEDRVRVLSTENGRLAKLAVYGKDEYRNQGREGFLEYEKV